MSFIEFLVFIFTMIALTILSSRKAKQERLRRQQHPEEYLEEEDDPQAAMKEFMKALNVDIDEVKEVKSKKKQQPEQKIPEPVVRDKVDIKVPKIIEKEPSSRARKILFKSGSLKDAIVLQEILGKPKGLQ